MRVFIILWMFNSFILLQFSYIKLFHVDALTCFCCLNVRVFYKHVFRLSISTEALQNFTMLYNIVMINSCMKRSLRVRRRTLC